jgi:hypothetical protein
MNSATRLSPEKLMRAIRDKGLTYAEAAQHARRHLPDDTRLSHTSVWSYATGRATPKRLTYIEAIEKALGVEPNGLSHDGNGNAASAEGSAAEAARSGEPPDLMLVVDDVRGNEAYLKVRASVPWPIALQILEALKGEANGAAERTL